MGIFGYDFFLSFWGLINKSFIPMELPRFGFVN
jgi:hypothetical protein